MLSATFEKDEYCTIEVSLDSRTGDGNAYFRIGDLGSTITSWEFSHPIFGTEYRVLHDQKNGTLILQTRYWTDRQTEKYKCS